MTSQSESVDPLLREIARLRRELKDLRETVLARIADLSKRVTDLEP